ncbi:hypothetical protein BJ742DRAFT_774321 [Cladochytrium replicatum]|nr:hypothetical protein BJ742DRAFT_774321 [Cladochytrium replicatum]
MNFGSPCQRITIAIVRPAWPVAICVTQSRSFKKKRMLEVVRASNPWGISSQWEHRAIERQSAKRRAEAKAAQTSDEQSEEKEEEKELGNGPQLMWFNDPVILSAHLQRLLEKGEYATAVSRLYQHKGTGTPEVYAAIFTILSKQGKVDMMWGVFETMLKNKKRATPKGYTSILNGLALSIRSQQLPLPSYIEQRLAQGITVMGQVPDPPPTPTVNAFLNLCIECIDHSGWEHAWDQFRTNLVPLSNAKSKVMPDRITFSNIFRLCAARASEQGFIRLIDVWADYLKLLGSLQTEWIKVLNASKKGKKGTATEHHETPEMKEVIGALNPLKPDAGMIAAFLMGCLRGDNPQRALYGLMVFRNWVNLNLKDVSFGTAEDEGWIPAELQQLEAAVPVQKFRVEVNVPLLTVAMNLSKAASMPFVGVSIFEAAISRSKKLGVPLELDCSAVQSFLAVCIAQHQFEKAWNFVVNTPTCVVPPGEQGSVWSSMEDMISTRLMVCAGAAEYASVVDEHSDNPALGVRKHPTRRWVERAKIINEANKDIVLNSSTCMMHYIGALGAVGCHEEIVGFALENENVLVDAEKMVQRERRRIETDGNAVSSEVADPQGELELDEGMKVPLKRRRLFARVRCVRLISKACGELARENGYGDGECADLKAYADAIMTTWDGLMEQIKLRWEDQEQEKAGKIAQLSTGCRVARRSSRSVV